MEEPAIPDEDAGSAATLAAAVAAFSDLYDAHLLDFVVSTGSPTLSLVFSAERYDTARWERVVLHATDVVTLRIETTDCVGPLEDSNFPRSGLVNGVALREDSEHVVLDIIGRDSWNIYVRAGRIHCTVEGAT